MRNRIHTDNLAYWDTRHAESTDPYEASWSGDRYARRLELAFVADHFLLCPASILELGCGAYTLDEHSRLSQLLANKSYTGLDGSETAIKTARRRRPGSTFHARDFEALDFTLLDYPRADFLLSRRLLQNLTKKARAAIISNLARFPAGLLLECTKAGLGTINHLRHATGHCPLPEPEFNNYLDAAEVAEIKDRLGAREHFPLSTYYAITRGLLNTRDSQQAYELSLLQPRGNYGPLQAFTWGPCA